MINDTIPKVERKMFIGKSERCEMGGGGSGKRSM
jgi:hypothetical protein